MNSFARSKHEPLKRDRFAPKLLSLSCSSPHSNQFFRHAESLPEEERLSHFSIRLNRYFAQEASQCCHTLRANKVKSCSSSDPFWEPNSIRQNHRRPDCQTQEMRAVRRIDDALHFLRSGRAEEYLTDWRSSARHFERSLSAFSFVKTCMAGRGIRRAIQFYPLPRRVGVWGATYFFIIDFPCSSRVAEWYRATRAEPAP
jgi:hypothetical protein